MVDQYKKRTSEFGGRSTSVRKLDLKDSIGGALADESGGDDSGREPPHNVILRNPITFLKTRIPHHVNLCSGGKEKKKAVP